VRTHSLLRHTVELLIELVAKKVATNSTVWRPSFSHSRDRRHKVPNPSRKAGLHSPASVHTGASISALEGTWRCSSSVRTPLTPDKGSRRGCNGDGGALASAGQLDFIDYHRYYAVLARLCTTMQGAYRQISERRPPNRGNSACIGKVKPTNSISNFVHETSRAHLRLRFRCDPASWLPPLFPSKW